jgi:hypothetical protein
MDKLSRKEIDKKIKKCQQLIISDRVITCLKELFEDTNDGMVAYEMGREYEKAGNNVKAFQCYSMAEDLFEDPNFKNMAQAALNHLVIDEIITKKKKRILK